MNIKDEISDISRNINRGKYDLDENEKKLVEIALWMVDNNPSFKIGGSILLKLKGIDIKRKIHDIDLITDDEDIEASSIKCHPDFKIDEEGDEEDEKYQSTRLLSKDKTIIDILVNEKEYQSSDIFSSIKSLLDAKVEYLNKGVETQEDKCTKDIFNILTCNHIFEYIAFETFENYLTDFIITLRIIVNNDGSMFEPLFKTLLEYSKNLNSFKWYDCENMPCLDGYENIIIASHSTNEIVYANVKAEKTENVDYNDFFYNESIQYIDTVKGTLVNFKPTHWCFTPYSVYNK